MTTNKELTEKVPKVHETKPKSKTRPGRVEKLYSCTRKSVPCVFVLTSLASSLSKLSYILIVRLSSQLLVSMTVFLSSILPGSLLPQARVPGAKAMS